MTREADEALLRLEALLTDLALHRNAMSAGEIDGFVTGLVVYPETVPAPEWFPHVWGEGTQFTNAAQADSAAAALMAHHGWIARTLANEPKQYRPVLEVDERTEEVLWKEWVFGFTRAMRLRPGGWAKIEGSDELDVLESVLVIETLYAAANGTSKLAREGLDLLDSLAPMLIGGMVQDLNARKRSRGESAAERLLAGPAAEMGEALRSVVPCACGSGRPRARCCGAK